MMISDAAIIAIMSAVPPTIASVAALIVSIKSNNKIQEVKTATDGIKDELVRTTRAKALLEGHEAGRLDGIEQEKKAIIDKEKHVEVGRVEGAKSRKK